MNTTKKMIRYRFESMENTSTTILTFNVLKEPLIKSSEHFYYLGSTEIIKENEKQMHKNELSQAEN